LNVPASGWQERGVVMRVYPDGTFTGVVRDRNLFNEPQYEVNFNNPITSLLAVKAFDKNSCVHGCLRYYQSNYTAGPSRFRSRSGPPRETQPAQ